jgi:hypothetical protein
MSPYIIIQIDIALIGIIVTQFAYVLNICEDPGVSRGGHV